MRLVLALFITLFLAACATPQLPITETSRALADKLQQQNQHLNSWQLTGRASVVTEQTAYYFNVFWKQNQQQYDLRFEAPLVSEAILLTGHEGFAELRLNKHKTIRGINPDQLITQAMGFNIPVTGLHSWVRGIAHKNSESQLQIKANGQTKEIRQDGWLIEYSDWGLFKINNKQYSLPSDIHLTHEQIKIRIRPSQWQQQQQPKINPIFSDLDFK